MRARVGLAAPVAAALVIALGAMLWLRPSPPLPDDEAQIATRVVRRFVSTDPSSTSGARRRLLLETSTRVLEPPAPIGVRSDGANEALADLAAKSHDLRSLPAAAFAPGRIDAISPGDVDDVVFDSPRLLSRLLGRGGSAQARWQELLRAHPDASGFLSLSRVGFAADRRTAVVLTRRECGPLCGEGDVYVLVLTSSGWLVKTTELEWDD